MIAYNNTLTVVVCGLIALLIWRAPQGQRARTADVLLIGLLSGLLLARLLHVAVQWAYFQDHPSEIVNVRAGGLDWHGAVWGALTGIWITSRVRRLMWPRLWGWLALVAPVLAFAAWWGCQSALCAHGREVSTLADFPILLVADARDSYGLYAPRFNTHFLGMILMVLVWLVIVPLRRRLQPVPLLGISLMLVAICMFSVGFLRGDAVPMVATLRADQWLDIAMMMTAAGLLMAYRRLMISSV